MTSARARHEAQDLLAAHGQAGALLGEHKPAPHVAHQHRARLGLEPLEVVGDGRLAVVEGLGCGRRGAVLGQRHEHLEPVDIDHVSIVSMASMVMVDNIH